MYPGDVWTNYLKMLQCRPNILNTFSLSSNESQVILNSSIYPKEVKIICVPHYFFVPSQIFSPSVLTERQQNPHLFIEIMAFISRNLNIIILVTIFGRGVGDTGFQLGNEEVTGIKDIA